MSAVRKIRVLVQLGAKDGYSTTNFIERDVTLDVLESEDMVKQLQFLMSDEFKAVKDRAAKLPNTRPLVEGAVEEQTLIGGAS